MNCIGRASQNERWVTKMILDTWASGGGNGVRVGVGWADLSRKS